MEESILTPQTPRFGTVNKNITKNINFSEQLKIKSNHIPNLIEKSKSKKKEKKEKEEKKDKKDKKDKKESKEKKEKSKSKRNEYISGKLSPSTLNYEKENPYYELLTKKIKLRNDFDRKHAKKFLAEEEEAFGGCDLDDEIIEDES